MLAHAFEPVSLQKSLHFPPKQKLQRVFPWRSIEMAAYRDGGNSGTLPPLGGLRPPSETPGKGALMIKNQKDRQDQKARQDQKERRRAWESKRGFYEWLAQDRDERDRVRDWADARMRLGLSSKDTGAVHLARCTTDASKAEGTRRSADRPRAPRASSNAGRRRFSNETEGLEHRPGSARGRRHL